MDKIALLDQLNKHLRELADTAFQASAASAKEAQDGVSSKERKMDMRTAIEYAGLARGQKQRAHRALGELRMLDGFRPRTLHTSSKIEVGAIVEVEDDDTGEGRTFFLAPAGAGVTLTGPGGDGYLSVVTPASPVGKAVVGRRCGEYIDVTVKGEPREWKICWIC